MSRIRDVRPSRLRPRTRLRINSHRSLPSFLASSVVVRFEYSRARVCVSQKSRHPRPRPGTRATVSSWLRFSPSHSCEWHNFCILKRVAPPFTLLHPLNARIGCSYYYCSAPDCAVISSIPFFGSSLSLFFFLLNVN